VTERREYKYCGSEQPPQRVKEHDTSLSLENAKAVIQKAWSTGRIHVGTHIKKRMRERGVDMIDLENIVRAGVVSGKEYCEIYKNWKYRMVGVSDERQIETVIALDSTEDFSETPLAVFLTVLLKDVGRPEARQGG
jgi:hypothetical protein